MTIKFPQDPNPSDSIDKNYISPDSSDSKEKDLSISKKKDSLEAFSSYELSSTKKSSDAPQLESPKLASDSFAYYFKSIRAASLALRHQFSASDLVDQESRRNSNQAALEQSRMLSELIEQRSQVIAQLERDSKQALKELQEIFKDMQIDLNQQQALIDQINAGNAQEKQQYQALNDAYQEYVAKLKLIGCIDVGNGNFSVPKNKVNEYNALTKEYQTSVENFNVYWKERQTQINQYNSAAQIYNERIAVYNQSIDATIKKYNLEEFLSLKDYKIPELSKASLRDLTGYLNAITAPSTFIVTPILVPTFPPPKYAIDIGRVGPLPIPKLDVLTPINVNILDGLHDYFRQTLIPQLDEKIQACYAFWAFLNMQNFFSPYEDSIPDPLLNTKKLAMKILPEASIESSSDKTPLSKEISSIAMQSIGLNSPVLQNMLGRLLLKQAIESFNLKTLAERDDASREKKIEQIVDELLFLSVGLLGNQSLQALFPSLNPIAHSLDSLPKDSPVFAILFTVSLMNRIQEDSKQGITKEALKTYIDKHPDLSSLSDENKSKLESIVNLGHLLVGAKLLGSSLGLEGLLNQILPSLLPPNSNPKTLISQASEEGRQSLIDLQMRLKQQFSDQGLSDDKALFLSQFGSQLAEEGLLAPNAVSIPSPQMVNQPLLINSLKASLVLADYPLQKADSITNQAVERTLSEFPYHSTKQFRTALTSHLQELGVGEKSSEIAAQAIISLPQEKSLPYLTPKPNPNLSPSKEPVQPSDPIPFTQLSPGQLTAIVEKRTLQLLTPQLGAQLANHITEEIAKTLFGTPHPDSQDIGDTKSPYSLTNIVKEQLYNLKIEQNQTWIASISETFKETIKSMEKFYPFSLKVMDPAYLFVYSAQAGIIYEDKLKKPIDIIV